MKPISVLQASLLTSLCLSPCLEAAQPIKLFILAGDECVLEEGVVSAEGKPGTLEEAIKQHPEYALLKDKDGQWLTRHDVKLYDAHPIHNNTEAPARPLNVVREVKAGPGGGPRMGVDLMLGHVLGDAIEAPVLIHRFAVNHAIWFKRGSRDLAHNYRPPSSGGNPHVPQIPAGAASKKLPMTQTKDGRSVFLFLKEWPGTEFKTDQIQPKPGGTITLLGEKEPLKWTQQDSVTTIQFPEKWQDAASGPGKHAYVLEIH